MRKLVFQQFLSLDGYAADKEHSTKFFDSTDWGKESDQDMLAEMQRFDTILLGANTYRMFVEFWPDADPKEQIVADTLNSIPKVVFSETLDNAPWGKWEPARIVKSDAAGEIRKLKDGPGKDLVLWGSISLARNLIKAGVIDEYQLRLVPLVLGEGTLQFEGMPQLNMNLKDSKKYNSGLVFCRYTVK
ncbi:MAG: reductase [Chitinophagaceae bacterium]|nr:MAG: reductase [Chitinophagaceae bacterium]